MCGIAGLLALSADVPPLPRLELVGAMNGTLTHRGPDDQGTWLSADGQVALAHRRLSIVDLSPLGRNPMLWDDGRLAITYNGEIYNFHELRRDLENRGYRFRSKTDTEVILAAYDAWGTSSLSRFAGMFAFALWDAARRRLWIARDRLGKKPLYYAQHRGHLLFGSELKALIRIPEFDRTVNRDALGLFLRYGYIPAPLSIFAGAAKLPAGHELIAEGGRVAVASYWDPLDAIGQPRSLSDGEAEEELERRLATAVRQRQIADVPLGAFLSGGVDSSLVVALMQEQSSTRAQTFTIRFEQPEFNEADHAQAVARHLGTDHHEELCDETRMLDTIEHLPAMFDEPFGDSSAIPTYLVSAAARRHVTVALSGDGGDEVFFGYPRYRYHADGGALLSLPTPMRLALAGVASYAPTRRLRRIADVLRSTAADPYGRFVEWCSTANVEAMLGSVPAAPVYEAMRSRLGTTARELRPPLLDLVSYLPDDILVKVDRASMAVGLEVRAPLLDHRVVEFGLGLPLTLKRRGGTMKWVLRRLLLKRVPAHLIDRPKMGFGVPLTHWFRGPLRERMDAYCRSSELEDLGLNPDPFRQMWREFQGHRYHRPDLLWQAFMLIAWSQQVRRHPAAPGGHCS